MILFYGCRDDEPLSRAVDAAREAGVGHIVLDQNRLAHYDLVFGPGLGDRLRAEGRSLSLDEVTAVYARPLVPPATAGGPTAQARTDAFHRWFTEWLDVAGALVVNRPAAMESNGSKPYQAQLIARAGFAVPDTLVTDDPDEVRAFRDLHGRIVYKSISGIRSVVRELTVEDESRLHLVRGLPTQFQAYVPGRDVRVHVVDGRTFATAVDSPAIDYRYAHRDGLGAELSPCVLPGDVVRRSVALSAALGLPLSGIDLRVRPDGEWVCFEVNPMPAYTFYESHTGQRIAAALVALLAGAHMGGPAPAGV
ncbi:RimK family alpha-L-glutamate ligase [Streptomyces sp. NPDC051018]|uniref:RimK family alpha-L-glutamate ligase n=1 Tax=Streptomyces sp. NPDC051018 TaxID=3365639 RepID=UPI0037B2DC4F